MAGISPYATIETGATLADDVTVGPFCRIGGQVTVGPGCIIESNVTIVGKTTLGGGNHVFPMAAIGVTADPAGPGGECVIGESNSFREHVTVYGGNRDQPTRIADDNLVMIGCTVGQGARVGNHGIFPNFTQIGAGAILEDYVRTGGFTDISAGTRMGAYTFIVGHTRIDHDAPPYTVIQGYPCRIRGIHSHKLKLCGFSEEDIRRLQAAFRKLYNGSGEGNAHLAAEMLDDDETGPYVRRLAEAVCTIAKTTEAAHVDG
jgi:UDP-N-acetylglucosamine acyltransferase